MSRKGYKYHLTVADVIRVFEQFPDLVLMRSGGLGIFPSHISRTFGTSTVTFRTCEALVKRGVIVLRDASDHTGYWIKGEQIK